ncbi:serine carboxypeptidase [Trifolium repens]|nr:serine carboxypeptidase [Trifolium repens]
MGYLLGNSVTTEKETNYKIPFAHGMGLISDELYESLQKNCNGDYVNVETRNVLCSRDMSSFSEVCDPNGRWYLSDSGSGPGDLLLITGRALSHATAGLHPAASYRASPDCFMSINSGGRIERTRVLTRILNLNSFLSSDLADYEIPIAGKWKDLMILEEGEEFVPEPSGSEAERKIWTAQLMIPFSVKKDHYAFCGPYPPHSEIISKEVDSSAFGLSENDEK